MVKFLLTGIAAVVVIGGPCAVAGYTIGYNVHRAESSIQSAQGVMNFSGLFKGK